MTTFRLHRGEAIDVLRTMPDNSVDSIVCDPPYGLKFMSKHWDYDLPSVDTWRECLRVLKPGGHLLAFAGTRTQHRMAVRIEDAGFEIRDMIAWMYGSGFPKSKNLDNAWKGWGTALKPAIEPITVARKPIEHKTVAANVLAHGTGAINIDACRVPLTGAADAAEFANNHAVTERLPSHYDGEPLGLHDGGWKQRVGAAVVPDGRWPANVIHDGSDEVVAAFPVAPGQLATASSSSSSRKNQNVYGDMVRGSGGAEPRQDAGSAARFFYAAKATRKDRGEGNNHPTVKPTDLMRYLCRLVTPVGGLVLDPFVGSGSTGKAAILEGFRFIGIDRDADENGDSLGYLDIARARIKAAGGTEVCDLLAARPKAGIPAVEQNQTLRRLDTAMDDLISALSGIRASVSSTNGTQDNTEDDL